MSSEAETAIEEVTTEEASVETIPEQEVAGPGSAGSGYRVILYNDDWHPIDQVVEQVQKATGYSLEKVWLIVLEAHYKGRAVCYHGGQAECHRVARVLREIRLQCEVDTD